MATNPPFLVLPGKARLLQLADYAVKGAWPPADCPACKEAPAGRCVDCTRLEADTEILGRMMLGVQVAETDGEAQDIVLAGLTELAAGGAR